MLLYNAACTRTTLYSLINDCERFWKFTKDLRQNRDLSTLMNYGNKVQTIFTRHNIILLDPRATDNNLKVPETCRARFYYE